MANFKVRFYGIGLTPIRTEDLWVEGLNEARDWARSKVGSSQTFQRARVYRGDEVVSEVGFRPNLWSDL